MDQGATVGILVGEAAQNIDGRLEPNLVKQPPPLNQGLLRRSSGVNRMTLAACHACVKKCQPIAQ